MGARATGFISGMEIPQEAGGQRTAPKVSEKQAVLAQVSERFTTLAAGLRATLEEEARGPRHGPIVYFVLDPTKDATLPEVRRQLKTDNFFGIAREDIASTPGFEELKRKCQELGMKFLFKEEWPEIMGDPKEGYEDTFVWHISISGW